MISLTDYFSHAQAYREIAASLENKDNVVSLKKEKEGNDFLISTARSESGILSSFPLLQQVLGTHQEVVAHFIASLEEEYSSEKAAYLFPASDRITSLKEGLSASMIQQVFDKNDEKETSLGVKIPSFVDASKHSGFYVSPKSEAEKKELEHLQGLHEERLKKQGEASLQPKKEPVAQQQKKKQNGFRANAKF